MSKTNLQYSRVLVFAAHPDDELTMAGTMAQCAEAGTEVYVIQMTDGSEGYPLPGMKDTIVSVRKQEALDCNKVLGIRERVFLDEPDMGLQHSKEIVLKCLKVIRRYRPEAIFTHGPADNHPDHRATHRISLDARWQAGQPVCAELGKSWKTPILFYYKSVKESLPQISVDVTATAYKRQESLATQVSQHTLFGTTREALLARAAAQQNAPQRATETFWIAECNSFNSFPLF